MPCISAANAFVLDQAEIAHALRIAAGSTVTVVPLANRYSVNTHGAEIIVRSTGAHPTAIVVQVSPAGGASTFSELSVDNVAGDRGTRNAQARSLDPARPFLIAMAGIIASSVAILVATFAALSSSSTNIAYQNVLSQVMAWMSATIVVATCAAILLQLIRVIARIVRDSRIGWFRIGWIRIAGRVAAIAACLALSLAPVVYGYFAAQAAVRGGIATIGWKPEDIPGLLRWFM